MADTTTTTRAKRTTPVALGEHEGDIPERTRSGFWKDQFEKTFKVNPGKVYKFGSVSQSTASNLRRDYGLNAHTATQGDDTILYVKWEPERAEQIKRETVERGNKRKATMEANKAKKAAEAAKAAKAGNRS